MVDFRVRLSPEGQARLDSHQKSVERFRAMGDAEFAAELKLFHERCEPPRWPLGSPVYDAVLHHVIIPEAIRRLTGPSERAEVDPTPGEPDPVKGGWAYFTTARLPDQRGEDWDDAPYEDNASPPYGWAPHRGVARYRLFRVLWAAPDLTPPAEWSSSLSVEQINRGAAPWLRNESATVTIQAGVTPAQFRAAVAAAGGLTGEPQPYEDWTG